MLAKSIEILPTETEVGIMIFAMIFATLLYNVGREKVVKTAPLMFTLSYTFLTIRIIIFQLFASGTSLHSGICGLQTMIYLYMFLLDSILLFSASVLYKEYLIKNGKGDNFKKRIFFFIGIPLIISIGYIPLVLLTSLVVGIFLSKYLCDEFNIFTSSSAPLILIATGILIFLGFNVTDPVGDGFLWSGLYVCFCTLFIASIRFMLKKSARGNADAVDKS